uniref:GATA-type domain-containing protein n=1 Tax=Meloidogyne enterolobii TaxID=390850 RepID=A0A6V7X3U0_MELEN|nr:unnamed protein product [Meloidogyne enterolobii]
MNKYYETSILDESLENIKINKKELLKENIENYKDKLSSSYLTEINLIGYKIELLEKQKLEYPKEELKGNIIYIGNKISGINEENKRHCFNCRNIQNKLWHKYIKENYLCDACDSYKRSKNGKLRPKEMWFKANQISLHDRNCSICDATHTSKWYRYSKPGHYLCAACYNKQQRIKKSIKNTKAYDRI